MANLMRRAADDLRRKTQQLKTIRENNKAEEQQMWGAAAAGAGVVSAALIDKKWGADGAQAELFDFLPANLSGGAAIAGTALAVKSLGKARLPLGMYGLGMALGSLYRYAYDNVDFET